MQEAVSNSDSSSIMKDWVNKYSDNMFSWALHKTSSKETAEDLVQETFLSALKSYDKFEGKSNPKTWLFSILNNKINDIYRSNFRTPVVNNFSDLTSFFDEKGQWEPEQRPLNWVGDSEHLLDNQEFQTTLSQCMHKLPQNWLSVVQLKYLEERNSQLICQELNISATNLWQILHRAKLQLRKCIEINWFKK